jgi:transposase-like protein
MGKGGQAMLKRKISAKDKVKLAIASFAEGINKTEFCAKHGISRSALYAWQKAILARLADGLH